MPRKGWELPNGEIFVGRGREEMAGAIGGSPHQHMDALSKSPCVWRRKHRVSRQTTRQQGPLCTRHNTWSPARGAGHLCGAGRGQQRLSWDAPLGCNAAGIPRMVGWGWLSGAGLGRGGAPGTHWPRYNHLPSRRSSRTSVTSSRPSPRTV